MILGLKSWVVLFALCAIAFADVGQNKPAVIPVPVDPPETTTNTVPPTSSITPEPRSSSSTSVPTSSTTPAPTTSTTIPAPTTSTTTPAPTTSTTTPVPTTTPAPITTPTTSAPTTPAPVTTTVAPPPVKPHKYVVVDPLTNLTCIVASMAVQFNISYPNNNKNVSSAIVDLPSDNSTLVSGTCKNDSQQLNLAWGAGNSLVLTFSVNDTDKEFGLSSLVLTLNATVLQDAATNKTSLVYNETSELFRTPLKLSYKCDKVQTVNLTSPDATWPSLAVLNLSEVQFQAFRNETGDGFGAAQDCDSFDTPDVVPIAVGCALTLLVLIVLAAYLIGRRRSQNRGYLSMTNEGETTPIFSGRSAWRDLWSVCFP